MADENEHIACVDAWMDRAAKGLPPERLLEIFERGFDAMWHRAHQTLGNVTLTAIADRVLYSATERFPELTGLVVETNGLRCEALRDRAASFQRDELAKAVRFVLVEFLTVLGNLTAEILTPALHAELSKIVPAESARDQSVTRDEPRKSDRNGEDAES